jgi:hypothetical protein
MSLVEENNLDLYLKFYGNPPTIAELTIYAAYV